MGCVITSAALVAPLEDFLVALSCLLDLPCFLLARRWWAVLFYF